MPSLPYVREGLWRAEPSPSPKAQIQPLGVPVDVSVKDIRSGSVTPTAHVKSARAGQAGGRGMTGPVMTPVRIGKSECAVTAIASPMMFPMSGVMGENRQVRVTSATSPRSVPRGKAGADTGTLSQPARVALASARASRTNASYVARRTGSPGVPQAPGWMAA